MCMWISYRWRYIFRVIPKSRVTGSKGKCTVVLLDIARFSYKEVSFCIPPSNVWEYLFPWLHSQIVFLSFWILASLIGKKWCLKVLIVLIYVFLIMVVKEYLFIYLMTYNKNCPPKMIFLCLLSLFLLSLILFFLPLLRVLHIWGY